MTSPIALFVYSRPEHTRRTVESLLRNELAGESDLIIFSDAARTPGKREAVNEVRAYLTTIEGFRSVTIHHRPSNFGLARSIIEGVTAVLQQHEQVIVLEDDMVTSPFFLTYMNEALECFANDSRIVSIHGYVYPVRGALPEAFFLPGADCWGWATWRRGWACFNPDGAQLLRELKQRKLERAFDFEGSYPYTQMLEAQIAGMNDSWAIRWYASAFLQGKLTLYPGRSLVHNIGNDASGTHCGQYSAMDTLLSDRPIRLDGVVVESSALARGEFIRFFRRHSGQRITDRIRRRLGLIVFKARAFYRRQTFLPGPLGVFVNPFYLARSALHRAMRECADELDGRLLDVGCGIKPYRSLFKVTEYVGLDIDSPGARQRGVADVFYSGQAFPFEARSFDAVLCNQVLEHVFNPGEFLAEIERVLRPGGKLLLTVPFVWDEHEQPWDYARYSSFGLKALLEKRGFRILSHRKLRADVSVLFQLANAYLFKLTQGWPRPANLLFTATVMAALTMLGLLGARLLPDNPDLYLDHVLLAEKPT